MNGVKSSAVVLLCATALVLIGWFGREAVGFNAKPTQKRSPEPPSISVTTVTNALFNPFTEYVGHVEAVQHTDILPQIDGYIRRVCFTEGARVEKDDLLFEIDPEPKAVTTEELEEVVPAVAINVPSSKAHIEKYGFQAFG